MTGGLACERRAGRKVVVALCGGCDDVCTRHLSLFHSGGLIVLVQSVTRDVT